MALDHIFTGFENASPLDWEVAEDGVVHITLNYDHERSSPNRAVLHWHFQLQGSPGDKLVLMLRPFDNIWNGRQGSPIRKGASCCISQDGQQWQVIQGEQTEENFLRLSVQLPEHGRLYVARIEPYRLSDAERLIEGIGRQDNVSVQEIGQTVEGRVLEMVSIGREDLPHSLLLRGRAHPWETGGNWVLEGLIRRMIEIEDLSFGLHTILIANMELNCNWSAGLNKAPLAEDWMLMGRQMYDAFSTYFGRVD